MRDAERGVIARQCRRNSEDERDASPQNRHAHRGEHELAKREDAGTHDNGDKAGAEHAVAIMEGRESRRQAGILCGEARYVARA